MLVVIEEPSNRRVKGKYEQEAGFYGRLLARFTSKPFGFKKKKEKNIYYVICKLHLFYDGKKWLGVCYLSNHCILAFAHNGKIMRICDLLK